MLRTLGVHSDDVAHVCKGSSLRAMPIDVRFRREGRGSAIARVVSFEGDLDNEQRARFEPIAEGTPRLTLKQAWRSCPHRKASASNDFGRITMRPIFFPTQATAAADNPADADGSRHRGEDRALGESGDGSSSTRNFARTLDRPEIQSPAETRRL